MLAWRRIRMSEWGWCLGDRTCQSQCCSRWVRPLCCPPPRTFCPQIRLETGIQCCWLTLPRGNRAICFVEDPVVVMNSACVFDRRTCVCVRARYLLWIPACLYLAVDQVLFAIVGGVSVEYRAYSSIEALVWQGRSMCIGSGERDLLDASISVDQTSHDGCYEREKRDA